MPNKSLLTVNIKACGYSDGFILRDIYFTLSEGEVLLITGRSGSGKTTLIRAITGTIEAAGGFIDGEIAIDGVDLVEYKPWEVYSLISYIPQEPWNAILAHTVYAEICHSLALNGINCVEADFNPLGVSKLMDRLTYTLSAGETHRVLWLQALIRNTKLLILDEPLIYLDQEARRIVKHFVKIAQHKENMGIIIADHDPFQWGFIDPKTIILDEGRIRYIGEWRSDLFTPMEFHAEKKRVEKGVLVRFRNVWFRYPGGDYVIKGFTDSFRRGLLTCIKGPNGSGKSTLLKIAAGALKPSRGIVERFGSTIYIPENPLLFFTMPTPREELLLSARGDENRVNDIAEKFNIKHVLDRPLSKLSSGERRRIALASAYLAGYDGYLIDEPTGGLDIDNAKAVIDVIESLVAEEKAIVLATHDETISKLADYEVQLT
ncbi:MAG: ATP-binding cassette domain-containing protein [Desulfurococcaceae archaeon]